MLLKKGKRGGICLLPEIELEAEALRDLMAIYEKEPLVGFAVIGHGLKGGNTIYVGVGSDGQNMVRAITDSLPKRGQ